MQRTLTEQEGMRVFARMPYKGYTLEGGEDSEGYPFCRVYVLDERGNLQHLRTFTDPDPYKAQDLAEYWIERVAAEVESAAHKAALEVMAQGIRRAAAQAAVNTDYVPRTRAALEAERRAMVDGSAHR